MTFLLEQAREDLMMKQLVGVAVPAAIREGGVYAFSYIEASWVHVGRSSCSAHPV